MTGDTEEIGNNEGLFHSINVPLKEGIDDENYDYIFNKIYDKTF